MEAIEGLACGNWLEGDHNVVQTSEFECLVDQTVLLSPIHRCANCVDTIIGTTTLYSNCTTKDSASPPLVVFAQSLLSYGDTPVLLGQDIHSKGFMFKVFHSFDLPSE